MPKPNAYSMFVKEHARRMQRNGEQVNMAQLFQQLGDRWSSLSEHEKKRYKERATNPPPPRRDPPSDQAGTSRTNSQSTSSSTDVNGDEPVPGSSNTCDTNSNVEQNPSQAVAILPTTSKRSHDDSMALVQPPHKKPPGLPKWYRLEGTEKPNRYRDLHLYKIQQNCEEIVKSRIDKLITIPLYAFSANVLCKYKDHVEKKDVFVPIEIGIYAYSLKSGKLGDPYHVLINAGDVPKNCLNISIDHATTHKITFKHGRNDWPPEARNDYKKIYKEIMDYTEAGERTIIISDVRDLAKVQGCLDWLWKKASEDGSRLPRSSTWTILPVVEIVTTMCNFVAQTMFDAKDPYFGLPYYLRLLMDSSSLDYNTALMCRYHSDDLDGEHTKWCAKSCAIKTFMNIENVLETIYKKYMYAIEATKMRLANKQNQIQNKRAEPVLPIEGLNSQAIHQPTDDSPPVLAIEAGSSRPSMLTNGSPVKQVASAAGCEEPLIIASSGTIMENPPDVF